MASGSSDDGGGSDPRWDSKYRRELRQDLREALTSTHRDQEEISVPDELLKRLKEGDELYKKVVSSREAVIDSEHIKLLSEIGRRQSESTRGELIHFDQRVYCQKLLTFMEGQLEGALDWCKLGEVFSRAFKTAPCGHFLYGALETVPVVKRDRIVSKRSGASSKTVERPKEISSFEEEETTTKDVQYIMSSLKKLFRSQERVHYFKFLVDPDSFAHTVENIFHFSFLVKEGRAGVYISEDDEQPYIELLPGTEGASQQQRTNQGIVSLDMATWKKLIEKHGINEAAIKRRQPK